jgi:hypothetical protein
MNKLNFEPAITAFAEIARQYCSWAESAFTEPLHEMLMARKLLAELHVAVLKLPDLGPGEGSVDILFFDKWDAVCSHFQKLPVNEYWDVFDPLKDVAPILNTLFDDLTDIYRDLKEGLLLYNRGQVTEAVWEWRLKFGIHWGAHLTGAQRAIHSYLSKDI